MAGFKHKKSVQALNYLAIREGGKINGMKAIKLLWLADRLHLRIYGRPITFDDYYALPHGPVGTQTKDIIEKSEYSYDEAIAYSDAFLTPKENHYIKSKADFIPKVFSETDREILAKIYDTFGGLDQFELRDLSHQFPEWLRFEKELKSGASKRYPMNWDDFFTEVVPHTLFSQNNEHLLLSKQYFKELVSC